MTKLADYEYKVYGNYLIIKDLNLGSISLTNSLEHVLKEIEKNEKLEELDIIQIDSEEEIERIFWDSKHEQVAWQWIEPEEKKKLQKIINQVF